MTPRKVLYFGFDASHTSVRKRMRQLQEPAKTEASVKKEAAKIAKDSARAASKLPKRKRKYPFRKTEDLEAEIAAAETRLQELERLLASSELYRDGDKVKDTTQAFEDTKIALKDLYEHWEEAVELNG